MFITYNDLDDMRDSRKRSQINAFVNRGRKANKVKDARRQAQAVQWQSRHPVRSAPIIKVEPEAVAAAHGVVNIKGREISKEVIYALLKRQRLPRLTQHYIFGAGRKDPFATFPISQTQQIDWAADFFMHTYSSMNASLYTDQGGNWLLNTLFPMALQSDMLFEALLLSMARYSNAVSKDALVPNSVQFVYLRSSVLGKLHRTLSMEDKISTSNTTIHTVICLIAADFFAGHDAHAATHLKGLQTLVSLRGGLENGNFDKYTKYNLAGTHALCQYAEQRYRETTKAPVAAEPELTYPKHPFSPQLCTDIAALPLGISEVALEGRLSEQVISVLCRLSKMAQDSPLTKIATTEQIYNVSIDTLNLVNRTSITALERAICLFVFVFIMIETPDRNESQHFYGQFLTNLRRQFREVAESFMRLDGVGADFASWGVAMIAIENSGEHIGLNEGERSDLFLDLLKRYPSAATWKQHWKNLKRFFFLDAWKDKYRIWWEEQVDTHRTQPLRSR